MLCPTASGDPLLPTVIRADSLLLPQVKQMFAAFPPDVCGNRYYWSMCYNITPGDATASVSTGPPPPPSEAANTGGVSGVATGEAPQPMRVKKRLPSPRGLGAKQE